jgi:hypothetical protein
VVFDGCKRNYGDLEQRNDGHISDLLSSIRNGYVEIQFFHLCRRRKEKTFYTCSFACGKTNNSLKFWMYRDSGYSSAVDSLEVYASLNGTDWTKLKGYKRYSTSNGWVENTVSLSCL